ncbi:tetratricopeptide repeat protein [Desulfobacterales bacterium HSG2]|nr:tetratricopeptide repeat protein [Desulfobacterales bacterium HSG2]
MDNKKMSGNAMNLYASLIIVGSVAIGLSAYLPLQIPDRYTLIVLIPSTALSLILTFIVTKKSLEKKHGDEMRDKEEKYKKKMVELKKEINTATLEKTIRDGTKTLIKNALDYFKLENIKNEMGDSAAIANLQLDKYGQIIELLADFSLILPDISESRAIVQKEIIHQIAIYQIDEKPFSMFLQRIMDKYIVTLNKKIQERTSQNNLGLMKTCPKCAERVMLKANVCKHCGHDFKAISIQPVLETEILDQMEKGKKFYRSGNYPEAIDAFTRVTELKPDYALGYYNRAVVYYKVGDGDAAENDLRKASRLGYKKADKLLDKKKVEKELI